MWSAVFVRQPSPAGITATLHFNQMSRKVRKRTFAHMRPANIHIRLRESSLGAFGIAKDAKLTYADNKDSDQAARMLYARNLVCVFIRHTCQKDVFGRCGS